MNLKIKPLLIEYQYFAAIDYFKVLFNYSDVIFSSNEILKKDSPRNRCYLSGPNGQLILSVPMEGGRNQKTMMKDVRISYRENWQQIHWRSIHDAYARSPWFESYAPELEGFYGSGPAFLFEWNMQLAEWALEKLNWGGRIHIEDIDTNIEMDDLRDVTIKKPHPPERANFELYQQVFAERHGFIANLSILDLLFCLGPSARQYLLGDKD